MMGHLCGFAFILLYLYLFVAVTYTFSSWITLSGPDGPLPSLKVPLVEDNFTTKRNISVFTLPHTSTTKTELSSHSSILPSHELNKHHQVGPLDSSDDDDSTQSQITTSIVTTDLATTDAPQTTTAHYNATETTPNDNYNNEKNNIFTKWVDSISFSTTFITWNFKEDNNTSLQVSLLPHQDNSSASASQQQFVFVQFKLVTELNTYFTLCDDHQLTCGPIVEVVTGLQHDDAIHGQPILEIKINKTKRVPYSKYPELWTCMYWSENDYTWKTDGVDTVIDDQFINCFSSHLTLFSVLLDPNNVLVPKGVMEELLPKHHYFVLSAISITGSLISIPSILLTIASYFCKKIPESETTKILIQSCIALLFTHFSYHIYHWLGQTISCPVVNFVTHYSVAAFLLWAACDGVNMWRMLFNDIFNTRGDVFYRRCKIFSWGLPLLTTMVGVAVTDFQYDTRCRLRFNQVCELILYIVPCTLILCCNLLLFVWMLTKVICKDSLSRLRNRKIEYVMALAQVFNIAWCIAFPLLWFHQTRLLGQYLFAVVVSTQGVFVFVVRCAKDCELRKRILNSVHVMCSSSFSTGIRLRFNSSKSYSISTSTQYPKHYRWQISSRNITGSTDSK